MWRNATSVPKENKRFYLTKKFLTKLNNGDTVLLREIVYSKGRQPVGATSNPSARIYLCSQDEDVGKSTFIRYECCDGKFEETRLDKLLKVRKLFQIKKNQTKGL